jgi:hypothetical protein
VFAYAKDFSASLRFARNDGKKFGLDGREKPLYCFATLHRASQTAQGQRRFRAPLATTVVASSSRATKTVHCTVLIMWHSSLGGDTDKVVKICETKKLPVSAKGTATLFVKEGLRHCVPRFFGKLRMTGW